MGKTFKDKKDYKIKVRKGKGLLPSRIHKDKKSKLDQIYGNQIAERTQTDSNL
jgi:uncharacterized C2H2 Zn-finger protein